MITVLHLRNPRTGAPYRKTLQYGFDLQQAVDAMAGRTGPHRWLRPTWAAKQRTQEIEADMYACGFLPPNHNLPAIRYELRVEEDFFGYGAVIFVRHEEGRMWFEHCIYATDEKRHEPKTLNPDDPEYYMQYT